MLRNEPNPHIRVDDYSKDVDFAHQMFLEDGYTDYNEREKNTPFIKMFFRGPEVSPYSRYRRDLKNKRLITEKYREHLTGRFPTVSYALVPACAKLAYLAFEKRLQKTETS